MLNALGRFELARRLVGEWTIIPITTPCLQESYRLRYRKMLTFRALGAYAEALRVARDARPINGLPVQLVPVVDIANRVVTQTNFPRDISLIVDSWAEFHWDWRLPAQNASQYDERNRLLNALAFDTFWADPAWRVWLDASEWSAVGLAPLADTARLVARQIGEYALYHTPGVGDCLYTSTAAYVDETGPLHIDAGWMEHAPSEIRERVTTDVLNVVSGLRSA